MYEPTVYTVQCTLTTLYTVYSTKILEVILHEVRIYSDEVYCSSWICFRTGDIGRNLKAYEEQVLNLLRLVGGARKSDFKLVRPARSYSSISGPHSLVQLLQLSPESRLSTVIHSVLRMNGNCRSPSSYEETVSS